VVVPTPRVSVIVAGDTDVPILCQKPAAPVAPPVMFPEQVRLPVVASRVHPVLAEPPPIAIVFAPSAMFKVVTVLVKRLKVDALEVRLPPMLAMMLPLRSIPVSQPAPMERAVSAPVLAVIPVICNP